MGWWSSAQNAGEWEMSFAVESISVLLRHGGWVVAKVEWVVLLLLLLFQSFL